MLKRPGGDTIRNHLQSWHNITMEDQVEKIVQFLGKGDSLEPEPEGFGGGAARTNDSDKESSSLVEPWFIGKLNRCQESSAGGRIANQEEKSLLLPQNVDEVATQPNLRSRGSKISKAGSLSNQRITAFYQEDKSTHGTNVLKKIMSQALESSKEEKGQKSSMYGDGPLQEDLENSLGFGCEKPSLGVTTNEFRNMVKGKEIEERSVSKQKLQLLTNKKFRCKEAGCLKAYTLNRNLNAHIKSFHKHLNKICHVTGCDKQFETSKGLLFHKHSCHKKITRICPEPGCGKVLSISSSLNRHIRAVHSVAK